MTPQAPLAFPALQVSNPQKLHNPTHHARSCSAGRSLRSPAAFPAPHYQHATPNPTIALPLASLLFPKTP